MYTTDLRETPLVEEILHDQDVHPQGPTSNRISISNLEEAINLCEDSRTLQHNQLAFLTSSPAYLSLEGLPCILKVCWGEFGQSVHFQPGNLLCDEPII